MKKALLPCGALTGVKVLDLSRVLGGPYCTQVLGDHGADVLKVEPPGGDETRTWGPPFTVDASAYFEGINRNKRGICLDLSTEEGQHILLTLLEAADVLVENFRPGTMERWGLSSTMLSERFPRLIQCRVSGFGEDGPLGGLPGYDAAIQATTGLMSVNGSANDGPTRLGVPVVDMATGLNAAIGILLALIERERSGRGQCVEVALFDAGLSITHPHGANHLASGEIPGRTGNDHPNICPYGLYATGAGDLFLAVGNDRQFRKLCEKIEGRSIEGDPRFETNSARCVHRHELRRALEELLEPYDAQELEGELLQAGVPCGTVRTIPEALSSAQARQRRMVAQLGEYKGIASPIKLDRTPAAMRRAPPRLGEHTDEVLSAMKTGHAWLGSNDV